MNNEGFGFGMFAGIALTFGVILVGWGFTNAKVSIDECEKDLPRSQECVLIAVPKSEIKE